MDIDVEFVPLVVGVLKLKFNAFYVVNPGYGRKKDYII